MGTLRRGVAAPDESGGLDLVLLPDLRLAYLGAARFRDGAFFGYFGARARKEEECRAARCRGGGV